MDLFTPREYLKIDIANSFGLDKQDWQDRISWFDQNEHQLDKLLPQAKEPALFYAGVEAWQDVLQSKPIGHLISLDATASGLQILTVLTGDRLAAKICNVVDNGKRMDAYTVIYKHMLAKIGEAAKIKQEDTKQAIMTAFFGSTAVPKEIFGKGALLTAFLETVQETAPACWELNEAFLSMWDPQALCNSWVLPDNFHVHIKVMASVTETANFLNEPFEIIRKINAPIAEGRSLSANMVHSIDGMVVREMSRRCSYDQGHINALNLMVQSGPYKSNTGTKNDLMVIKLWEHYLESGYLSARILDHLHTNNMGHVDPVVIKELLDSLPKKPFAILTVHD